MDQYRPCGCVANFSELQETIKGEDYQRALQQAEMFGLSRLDVKDFSLLMKRLFQV